MIQFGNDKIKEIYVGSDKIKEVYHGSDLVWKMDSGIIQDGYWVHKDTGVKTYFGLDADFINNGVMGIPDWKSDAVEVNCPDGLTSIGAFAFDQCSSLTSLTLPYGLTSIGTGAFRSCTSLTSITFPDSLTSLGASVFLLCSSLASITFPDGLTSIGNFAFGSCSYLSLVTSLPTVPPTLGNGAFNNTHASLAIKVPAQSVDAYKAATNWISHASKISAI